MIDQADVAEQLGRHLSSGKLHWLLGAGVSHPANIPLMVPLTDQVLKRAREEVFPDDAEMVSILNVIIDDIPEGAHIEIFLTHLTDLIALASRSRENRVRMASEEIELKSLQSLHSNLLTLIAQTLRWGHSVNYIKVEGGEDERVEKTGGPGNSIVDIRGHQNFVRAVFGGSRAGLEDRRNPVEFFTTNYDTLLEDALSLEKIPYTDGMHGGGVGFWEPEIFSSMSHIDAKVFKLHGSIDWRRSDDASGTIYRVRNDDTYPSEKSDVMIYPQATKYELAQSDPFSNLFNRFRDCLAAGQGVLAICGYSFGDEHINADIRIAMRNEAAQLTIIAFVREGEDGLPPVLDSWRLDSWSDRIFIVSDRGIYNDQEGPFFTEEIKGDYWTFAGAARLLQEGLPAAILEVTE